MPMMVCMTVAGHSSTRTPLDVYEMLIFGFIGLAMERLRFPMACVIVRLVLGTKAEFQSAHRAQAVAGRLVDLLPEHDQPDHDRPHRPRDRLSPSSATYATAGKAARRRARGREAHEPEGREHGQSAAHPCLPRGRPAASFTRAADRLSLSQPALTNCIRQLEHLVGVALFNRTTWRVRLTKAGEDSCRRPNA